MKRAPSWRARGYDAAGGLPTPAPLNGDAQIDPVSVAGDWSASNLVAGARNPQSTNLSYGDGNDQAIGGGNASILSKIASITIGGRVTGTAHAEHYGFVAEQIGSCKNRRHHDPSAGQCSQRHASARRDVWRQRRHSRDLSGRGVLSSICTLDRGRRRSAA